MRIFAHALFAAFASFGIAACAANTDATGSSTDSTSATSEELTVAKQCATDAQCGRGVCNPICPVIPGRMHCMIVGGTCGKTCSRSEADLAGTSFKSADSAHAITFAADGTFNKTDGCAQTGGITCHHIQLTTGYYVSNGKKVTLYPDLGEVDTLAVAPHCFEGLVDDATGVTLYPN